MLASISQNDDPVSAAETALCYSQLADDPDMAELIAVFVEELPIRLAGILQATSDQDWAEVWRLAHQLKGAGGSYGFPQITLEAGRLERAAREQPGSSDAIAALNEFAALCGRIRAGAPR